VRWIVATASGAVVFASITLVSAFCARNLCEGYPPFDVVVAVALPLLIGILAGIETFRVALQRAQAAQKRGKP